MIVFHSSKGQWEHVIKLIIIVIVVFFFISFFMSPIEGLKNLRVYLGLDELKDKVSPPKLCTDVPSPNDVCNGAEASLKIGDIEEPLEENNKFFTCTAKDETKWWNKELTIIECEIQELPACSYDFTEECVCVSGGGVNIISAGETCDQECLEGASSCSGDKFCREDDINCIISVLNERYDTYNYYFDFKDELVQNPLFNNDWEIKLPNKNVCILNENYKRTNYCDQKNFDDILNECGFYQIDNCVCFFDNGYQNNDANDPDTLNDDLMEVRYLVAVENGEGAICGIIPAVVPNPNPMSILTTILINPTCQTTITCEEYDNWDTWRNILREQLCTRDPCEVGNCEWDDDINECKTGYILQECIAGYEINYNSYDPLTKLFDCHTECGYEGDECTEGFYCTSTQSGDIGECTNQGGGHYCEYYDSGTCVEFVQPYGVDDQGNVCTQDDPCDPCIVQNLHPQYATSCQNSDQWCCSIGPELS